jgi:16S rRNA (uracil1498-N3)-methyltransferase
MPCYYLPEIKNKGEFFTIQGEEFHHLCQVLRMKENQEILLTSGTGVLATCRIVQIDRKKAQIKIIQRDIYKRSEPQMALAFALLKNKHDNLIIEKATEIGCSRFYPFETERTVRRDSRNLIPRFQKIAISAVKQCDNAFIPLIAECESFEDIFSTIIADGFLPVVALENCKNFYLPEIQKSNPLQAIALVIGPEGGFSENEITFMKDNNILTTSLGNHILRAETAAIAAIAQLAALNLQRDNHYY